MTHGATDEQPHPHPADDDPGRWSETWSFDFAAADGDVAGWARVTRHRDVAWYEAGLVGPRRQLLTVLDFDVPSGPNPFELRTEGLWADHTCETAFEHWTVGLEAFALGVDDPLELYGRQLGDRVPLGFDLEWETDGPVLDLPGRVGVAGYEVPCRVHGEVLVGATTIDLDGVGGRSHAWGPIDWWSDEGWHLTGVVEGDRHWSVDHRAGATVARVVDRDHRVHTLEAHGELAQDEHGLPTSARVVAGDAVLRVEVLAVAPVLLEDRGRQARRPRALCRLRADGGWIGVGWLEVRDGPGTALGAG